MTATATTAEPRGRLLVRAALLLLLAGCSSDGLLLTVDLRTDLQPAAEFDGVRTQVLLAGDERVVLRDEALADPARSYVGGVRIAEADGLASGTYVARVQLVRGGAIVAERTLRFEVTSDRGLVVVITRSCSGVACPGPSDDIAATTCAGGRCVDPRCAAPGDPACPPADCSVASDCPAAAAECAEAVCLDGACGHRSVAGACPSGTFCDPSSGCAPIGPLRDGGVVDGGGDASHGDGGTDAGGVDASADGGPLPTTNVQVAAGTSHTCAVGSDSRAYCWGSNTYGQLGVAGSGSISAQRVVPLPDVSSIAVDFGHTCAVTTDRALYCWGRNDEGQLGDGTTTDRATPALVSLMGNARSVSLGAGHTCVLLDSGAIQCWGDNAEGQLGTGDTGDRSTPVLIGGPQGYSALAVGDFHSCGVKTSGEVHCWGSNGRGQLGRGAAGGAMSTTPGAVTSIGDADAISADYRLTCAHRSTGAVACWGEGISGQLGNGTMADSDVAVPVSGIGDAVDVSAGAFHACAVLRRGEARCWGDGAFGKLGDGSTTSRSVPIGVVGVTDFVRVSAGTGHFTCGVRAPSGVVCWGRNDNNQLGTGDGTDHVMPTAVVGLP